MYYKLNEQKQPVKIDMLEWASNMASVKERIVKQEMVDGVRISTVFLGMDHGFGDGPPILFETMIFGGEHDSYQKRYFTWDESVKGHQVAIDLVKLSQQQEEQQSQP